MKSHYRDKITAVVTVYNKPQHIVERCIKSITDLNLKYIIVEDMSTEYDTEYLKHYDNVIFNTKNEGCYEAFEIGFRQVKTEYVLKMDADDYIIGYPDVSSNHDAYVNNIDNSISLIPKDFAHRPYAGLNGIVAKTSALLDAWTTELKFFNDIIIFTKLINRYDCVLNDTNYYVYDKEFSGIISLPFDEKMEYVIIAKKLALKEVQEVREAQERQR